GRILDWADLVQTPAGDDKSADMLAQVARKADNFADQCNGLGQAALIGVQPQRPDLVGISPLIRNPPDQPRKTGCQIRAEAHDLAHLADSRAGAEMDHRGAKPGTVTAIAFIDPLNDLFAPLMFEIDINIRWL